VKPICNTNVTFARFQSDKGVTTEHDPNHINVSPDEYSKSGGDHLAGSQDASYKSQSSHPSIAQEKSARESAMKEAIGKENHHRPLEFSPANPDLSDTTAEKDWQPQPDLLKRSSVRVSPLKSGDANREKKFQGISVKINKNDDERPSHSKRNS
jgi:hypothetical protein